MKQDPIYKPKDILKLPTRPEVIPASSQLEFWRGIEAALIVLREYSFNPVVGEALLKVVRKEMGFK